MLNLNKKIDFWCTLNVKDRYALCSNSSSNNLLFVKGQICSLFGFLFDKINSLYRRRKYLFPPNQLYVNSGPNYISSVKKNACNHSRGGNSAMRAPIPIVSEQLNCYSNGSPKRHLCRTLRKLVKLYRLLRLRVSTARLFL